MVMLPVDESKRSKTEIVWRALFLAVVRISRILATPVYRLCDQYSAKVASVELNLCFTRNIFIQFP